MPAQLNHLVIGVTGLAQLHPQQDSRSPYLVEEVATPSGPRVLRSPGAMLPPQ